MTEYENLRSTGPVGVSLEQGGMEDDLNILIMGPTGAGKSTFVEALGWNGDQPISSSHLDSFTQTISTYRVNNLTTIGGWPIRLVDSPGFADTQISESAIVSMLKKWLEDNRGGYFHRIFYLIPITHARLSGSQRHVLETFQALTGIEASSNIMIITTMWDSIYGEAALKRAEGTYQRLQDEIWKDYIRSGARVVKFHNMLHSALSILNTALHSTAAQYFHIEEMVKKSQSLHQTPFGTHLYTGLQDRIKNLQSARSTLLLDLEQAMLPNEAELQALLLQRLQQVEDDLARFLKELENIGPLPDSTLADPQPTASIAGTINTSGEEGTIRTTDDEEHATDDVVISTLVPDAAHDLVPTSPLTAAPPSFPSDQPTSSSLLSASAVPAEDLTQGPPMGANHAHQSRISRVLASMKCWGKTVLEGYDTE